MKVVLEKKAAKYLESLDMVMKHRINEALKGLAKEPPYGDITKLQGENGYYKIAPRGQVYKEK